MSKTISKEQKKYWQPGLGIFMAVAIFLGSQILVGIIVSFYPLLRHWNSNQANNWLNNSIAAQFVFVLLTEAAVLGLVYLFVRRYKDGFKALGLRRPKWTDPLLGLVGLPAYLLIYLIAVNIATYFVPSLNTSQKQNIGFNNPHGAVAMILTFISLVILPPIGEEIIFRGLLYSSLKKLMSLWPAVILTSLIFAAGHLPEGGSAGPLYIAAIDTFSLSLVLIYLREKTEGIWASMTLHALKNLVAFAALYLLH